MKEKSVSGHVSRRAVLITMVLSAAMPVTALQPASADVRLTYGHGYNGGY